MGSDWLCLWGLKIFEPTIWRDWNNNNLTPLFWYQIAWEKLLLIECLEDSDIISITMFRIHYSLLKKLRNNFRKKAQILWSGESMTIFNVYLGREFHATQELEYHEIVDLYIYIYIFILLARTFNNNKGVPIIGNLYRCPNFYFIPKSIHVHLFSHLQEILRFNL